MDKQKAIENVAMVWLNHQDFQNKKATELFDEYTSIVEALEKHAGLDQGGFKSWTKDN